MLGAANVRCKQRRVSLAGDASRRVPDYSHGLASAEVLVSRCDDAAVNPGNNSSLPGESGPPVTVLLCHWQCSRVNGGRILANCKGSAAGRCQYGTRTKRATARTGLLRLPSADQGRWMTSRQRGRGECTWLWFWTRGRLCAKTGTGSRCTPQHMQLHVAGANRCGRPLASTCAASTTLETGMRAAIIACSAHCVEATQV